MHIVADSSLSQHHTAVVGAVMFIFKSLGVKCLPYLEQVVPSFVKVIRSSETSFREVSEKIRQAMLVSGNFSIF